MATKSTYSNMLNQKMASKKVMSEDDMMTRPVVTPKMKSSSKSSFNFKKK